MGVTQDYQRYGVFFTPVGALAETGAAWLGWDIATGRALEGADLKVVKRPQKYGFHGTLKPPFALAEGCALDQLQEAFTRLCATEAPVSLTALDVSVIGGFLALTPVDATPALQALAGGVVRKLDRFRAPPTEQELQRRRRSRLTPAQEAHLQKWGYPFVFDQFRFHMTLSGHLKPAHRDQALNTARARFMPVLPRPFHIDALSLVGERPDGMFEIITRRGLSGKP